MHWLVTLQVKLDGRLGHAANIVLNARIEMTRSRTMLMLRVAILLQR
jgi:hypothetical protein